jgi:anti-anti-sigma factor
MRNLVSSYPTTVVQPSGILNADNIAQFHQELVDTISSHHCECLVVDLGNVESLDSNGLMTLVSAYRLAQRLGKQFSLCAVSPSVRIMLELTKLDNVFDILVHRPVLEIAA